MFKRIQRVGLPMRHAAALLARGWYRGSRGWWRATAAVLAVVSSLVVLVIGVFEGMERATDERIQDFFTGDLRVTPLEEGAAPEELFNQTHDAVGRLQKASPRAEVTGRVESTYVLSRRSFLESIYQEDSQYRPQAPGVSAGGPEFYGIGILLGLDMEDPASVDPIRPYRTVGSLPAYDPEANDTVPILMSPERLKAALSEGERANLTGWPPSASELADFSFELSAGRIDESSRLRGAVITRPARVVGLFETGLDALDTFTIVVPIQHARELLGIGPEEPAFNAITVRGPAAGARAAAAEAGWAAEGSASFAQRYIGQLVAAIEALSLLVATLFLSLPVFLLWHGLAQVLDRNEREVAVCRAIGVPALVVRAAVGRVTAAVCLAALAGMAALVLAAGAWLEAKLPGWPGSPVPLAFAVPARGYALTVLLVLATAAASAWLTIRSHEKANVAARLRTA